ncbi:MAG: hypothetical protein C4293_18780, partial [Nitrospiraceae bacterium]
MGTVCAALCSGDYDALMLPITRPWSRMSLQTKVSVVILLIVGLSAISGEYFEREYVSRLARENFEEEMMAVVRQIDAGLTTLSDFRNRTAREMELDKLMATRPDLIDVALYEVPAGRTGPPTL